MSETQKPSPRPNQPPTEGVQKPLFSSRVRDGVHVIAFSRSDVVDAGYINRLGDQIYHHFKTIEAPRLVIDMDNVQQLSSAALGMLIALKKVTDKQGGRICIANVREDLVQVFKLTKLNRLLKIHPSTDNAVSSLT